MRTAVALAAAAVVLLLGVPSGGASTPSRIVFAANRVPSVTGEIYRLDANGHRVDLSLSPYQDTNPAVSWNGKRVAFLSDRSGTTSLYEVGIDGRGLVPLGLSVPLRSEAECDPQLAWQPHGNVLAVAACGFSKGWLWLVRPGEKPLKLLTSKDAIQPLWSPEGHVLAGRSGLDAIRAFSPTGRALWTRSADGPAATWSPSGLLAVAAYRGAAVYDEAGRLRFHFQLPTESGEQLAWSPDGGHLAVSWSVKTYELQVRTAAGNLVLRKSVKGGNMTWSDSSTVVFGDAACPGCKATGVDIRTGKTSPASNWWLDPLSADRKVAIVTPAAKPNGPFALGVARPGGGSVKTYSQIGGCYADGIWTPAATSAQFAGRTRSIVYQSGNHCDPPFASLYSVAPNGSGLQRLTTAPAQETQPTLSLDGSEIAYVWAQANGMSCAGCSDGIRVVNADGTNGRTLTNPDNCTFDDSPAWSPDGKTILYSETQCDSGGALFTIPAAGGARHDLKIAGESPAWGRFRIAYVGSEKSDSGVWTANPDGSGPTRVAKAGNLPAWSEDGQQLAYTVGSGNLTVVVGSTEVKLPFLEVTSLAWSADGTRFAVTARTTKTGSYDVYTVKTDGTDPVRVTTNYGVLGARWG